MGDGGEMVYVYFTNEEMEVPTIGLVLLGPLDQLKLKLAPRPPKPRALQFAPARPHAHAGVSGERKRSPAAGCSLGFLGLSSTTLNRRRRGLHLAARWHSAGSRGHGSSALRAVVLSVDSGRDDHPNKTEQMKMIPI